MAIVEKGLKKINKKLFPSKLFFGPEYIVLGVNNVCNLHCKMCDVGTGNLETNFAQNLLGASPLNMPIELFKAIVNQTKAFYPNAKIGYAFTEPLVYTFLGESLEYAHSKGIYTSLTTNALNLKRKADELVKGNLKELFISLDGLEKTHNFIRGNKNSFQNAIEGIELLHTLNPNIPISVFCVITEWNYTELYDFVEFMSRLPIKQLGFMHQNFTTKTLSEHHNKLFGHIYPSTHSNIEQTTIDAIDLNVLDAEIKKIKSLNSKIEISFSPNIDTIEKLTTFYKHPETKVGTTCNDVFTNMMIKSDGSVIPAHGRCYNVSMGNVNTNTLQEIWNSAIYGKFRSDLVKAGGLFPACNRCCSAF